MQLLPRSREDNWQWLQSKPLFGPDRVDFYVSSFRGSRLAFLATSPDTCCRIEEISLDGELIYGPGRVCKALGLSGEATGDVSFDGRRVMVRLHPTPRLRR